MTVSMQDSFAVPISGLVRALGESSVTPGLLALASLVMIVASLWLLKRAHGPGRERKPFRRA